MGSGCRKGGSQLELPQALMQWGQQCRGFWRLEVVEGSLQWGHPGLGQQWVEEEALHLGAGLRVLGLKDSSRRGQAGSCSRRALGSA